MSAPDHPFRTIALFGRYGSPGIAEPLRALAMFLSRRGHRVLLEAASSEHAPLLPGYAAVPIAEIGREAKLAIVLGGDGTMLSIARRLAPYDVPLIGVNQGRLGFLTDIALTDMESMLSDMLSGAYVQETRTLLEAELARSDGTERTLALNDVVVNRGSLGIMIDCAVAIDGRFVYAMRGDGLIVATPTGSTAYALSAQGPIVDPGVAALLLVPVAPHAFTNRPIAVRDSVEIEIRLLQGSDAGLHCDGQADFALSEGDRVVVRRSPHRLRLLHPRDHDYFAMLRQKLHWSETPERLRLSEGR